MKIISAVSLGWIWIALFISLSIPLHLQGQEKNTLPSKQKISIEWSDGKPSGTIEVLNGNLTKIEMIKGRGKVKNNRFGFTSSGSARIALDIDNTKTNPGPGATLISIKTETAPFSFLLRDVTEEFPIYIPEYSVVVLSDSDNRSYAEVQMDILSRNLLTKTERIESDPEESFASAGKQTLNQSVPTWLGISRDFRIFQITEGMPNKPLDDNYIVPKFSATQLLMPNIDKRGMVYIYKVGRGTGCEINTTRQLEEGMLPILHSTHIDDDIEYYSTYFVSLEQSPLTEKSVMGTHYLVADKYSNGHMFTEEQEERLKPILKEAFNTPEETVLYFRSEITNRGNAPHYAWFKSITPNWYRIRYFFDSNTGFTAFSPDSVFCVSKLNGEPLPNVEMAVLLQPGEKAVFDFFIPHSPISDKRAQALSTQSFDEKFIECKAFWQTKLNRAARIHVPEKRINEMIQAGLLHLDLITYGKEPKGTLAPNIGVYSPIGTESSPIIQFYASMGWNDIARRSLTYFLDKQHKDGFIQNFNGYMVETGAALWSMGEYFRYTNDQEWVRQIEPKLLKSCNYLLDWRNKNKTKDLRNNWYGLIDGKVADPKDPYHSYMLNGYAYLGISRVAEMLEEIDPDQSNYLRKEAEAWKRDIRTSFFIELASSPVVPLGDGTWCQTIPPWPEATGIRALYVNKEKLYSHGTFMGESLIGPMYLVFCEVLDIDEAATNILLDYHRELFYHNNVAFSQPYYSRHDWVQAQLGLVKPFLKTYYNTFSGLADRETYTFWEHYYDVSPHKTHEEAWFLMETRWMLYLEDGQTLKLLNTIPRKWLEDGKSIELNGVRSYFGPLNIKVQSEIDKGYIEASIQCDSDRKPDEVTIRLPHPEGKKAVKVTGGDYDPDTETVHISTFSGNTSVRVEY